MQQQVKLFLAHLSDRRMSPHTLSAYRGDLARFVALHPTLRANQITSLHLDAYLATIATLATNTRARKFAALRSFFAWLHLEGIIASNPTRAYSLPHQRGTQGGIPYFQIRDIVEKKEVGTRNRAILELIALGVRPGEIAFAMAFNLDPVSGRLTLDHRHIDLNEDAHDALLAHLEQRPPTESGHMFLNCAGRPMSRQAVWKILKTTALPLDITPTTLRNSRARHLLASGKSVAYVASQLGHKDQAATKRYLAKKGA